MFPRSLLLSTLGQRRLSYVQANDGVSHYAPGKESRRQACHSLFTHGVYRSPPCLADRGASVHRCPPGVFPYRWICSCQCSAKGESPLGEKPLHSIAEKTKGCEPCQTDSHKKFLSFFKIRSRRLRIAMSDTPCRRAYSLAGIPFRYRAVRRV